MVISWELFPFMQTYAQGVTNGTDVYQWAGNKGPEAASLDLNRQDQVKQQSK